VLSFRFDEEKDGFGFWVLGFSFGYVSLFFVGFFQQSIPSTQHLKLKT